MDYKPDKVNGSAPIKFLHYNTRHELFDSIDSLLDLSIASTSGYGCLLDTSYNNYNDDQKENTIVFEVFHLVNIWAYGQGYYDSGGRTPSTVKLYKKQKETWKLLKDKIETKDNEWYVLFPNLNKGVYKLEVESNYVSFTQWYVEKIAVSKYLIKSQDKIYSVKKTFYTIEDDKFLNVEKNFDRFGFELADLTTPINRLSIIGSVKDVDKGYIYEFSLNNCIESIDEVS